LFEELAPRNVGPRQARIFNALAPVLRDGLRSRLGVTAQRAARARERVLAEFAEVDARLADGRPYLCGDRFSAADLSFAALASLALLVQPEEGYGAWLPSLERSPSEFADFARELRATRAGEFVLRMFADERGRA
jgi:glutathione S-transferase